MLSYYNQTFPLLTYHETHQIKTMEKKYILKKNLNSLQHNFNPENNLLHYLFSENEYSHNQRRVSVWITTTSFLPPSLSLSFLFFFLLMWYFHSIFFLSVLISILYCTLLFTFDLWQVYVSIINAKMEVAIC